MVTLLKRVILLDNYIILDADPRPISLELREANLSLGKFVPFNNSITPFCGEDKVPVEDDIEIRAALRWRKIIRRDGY